MSHFEGLFITIYYSVQKQPIGNEPLVFITLLLHKYIYASINFILYRKMI